MIFTDLIGTKGGEWFALWTTLMARLTTFTNSLSGVAATSASANDISTGSKPFTLNEAAVDFGTGILLRARQRTNQANYVVGLSTVSAAGSVTIDATETGGSGAGITDWLITTEAFASSPLIGTRETDESGAITAADHGQAVRVLDPALTAPAAITMTFASAATLGEGKWGIVENRSGMTITLAATGGEIDEESSIELPDRAAVLWLVEDGEITIPLARGYPEAASPSAFTIKTGNYTAGAGDRILADMTGGAWTLTLPPTPAAGDTIEFMKYGANILTVGRNSEKIEAIADDGYVAAEDGAHLKLTYLNSTYGWVYGRRA